jgi:hypothetical protein
VGKKKGGDFSRRKLRRLGILVGALAGSALAIAAAGLWWWPFSLLSLPLLWVLWRETDPGGLLDPVPHLKGVRGEASVGEILEGLGSGHRILHGIDTGRGNVDHVVTGPTGVFAIETKNVSGRFELRHGRFTKDGHDATRVLRQAKAEAMAMRDRLRHAGMDRWVEAVVASSNARVDQDRLQAENVTVVAATALRAYIQNRTVRLSPEDIADAEEAIGGPSRGLD